MTIAIGGWLLLMVANGSPTVSAAVTAGTIVRGFDTASDCEKARQPGQVCVPALALVNR